MSLPPASAWIFALWVLTIALAAPLIIGACLGARRARAQRRVVRGTLLVAPFLLVGGLWIPDPFNGRPLWTLPGGQTAA